MAQKAHGSIVLETMAEPLSATAARFCEGVSGKARMVDGDVERRTAAEWESSGGAEMTMYSFDFRGVGGSSAKRIRM